MQSSIISSLQRPTELLQPPTELSTSLISILSSASTFSITASASNAVAQLAFVPLLVAPPEPLALALVASLASLAMVESLRTSRPSLIRT